MRFIWDTNMTGDLGLKGNELLIYSVIASFSQGRVGCFYGSLEDLAGIVGCTKPSANSVLKSLVGKGLIAKHDIYLEGCRRCAYTRSNNFTEGGKEILPNNKSNNDEDKSSSKKDNKYTNADFLNDLLSLGVPYEDADAWMKVRKGKGGVSTKRAFELTREEIEKSGYTPTECVQVAILRNWCGIKADWVQNHMAKAATPRQSSDEAEKAKQERIRQQQLKNKEELKRLGLC